MGSVVPPHYVFMSRHCLAAKLRQMASLLEAGSSA
ncbi:hypothetical protein ERHA54_50350 (plasmid) [Erwinia rhapontici]|nr:hypothetical protein ERHA54_50350 [Erwinia rhapontici]